MKIITQNLVEAPEKKKKLQKHKAPKQQKVEIMVPAKPVPMPIDTEIR